MASTHLVAEIPGVGWQEPLNPDRISGLLPDRTNLLWLDITDPGPAEIELLKREFGFHELALEDVERQHQRAKCDSYPDYYFLVLYGAGHSEREIVPRELQVFWGSNYLVTIHRGPLPVIEETRKRWENHEDRQSQGLAYLVYTLLDSVVDEYFPLLDWLEERVEGLEESILGGPDERVLSEMFRLRRELLHMRKLVAPTREVINEVLRRNVALLPESLVPYFTDVYDHSLRVLDGLDTFRDLLAAGLDLYLSAVSNRLNATMKRMTALTLIVMVPTLVAGIYGMNFERSLPPFDWPAGFAFAMALMTALIVGGLVIARRLDWL
jgi:magnesium transporter